MTFGKEFYFTTVFCGSLFKTVLCLFFIHVALQYNLTACIVESSASLFLFRIALAIWIFDCLCFHVT